MRGHTNFNGVALLFIFLLWPRPTGRWSNKTKCKFLQSSVIYLGHLIDSAGLHPTMDKLPAVRDAPPPKDAVALKSFLGLFVFYSRFMPHHSSVLAPLNNLLKKNVP